jgi:DNA-binding NarL/FixJ family response regulator
MDIHLPGRSGIACVARLRTLLPQTHVIMLTIEEDSEQVFESMKAGATGYLVKHAAPGEILEAVAEVHGGGAPMSSHIARKVVTAFRQPSAPESEGLRLSPREEEVLRLLAKGHRSKEIADELGVGLGTVNTYVRHIYEKLHVRSRAEAVARFMGR